MSLYQKHPPLYKGRWRVSVGGVVNKKENHPCAPPCKGGENQVIVRNYRYTVGEPFFSVDTIRHLIRLAI